MITGKAKEIELHVFVDECRKELVNLTPYEKPPYFQMMRADVSEEERDKAYRDWKHSLPPSISSVIDYEPN